MLNEFELLQNYPNPFNPITTIEYSIPDIGTSKEFLIQLKVYDIIGCEVATIINQNQNPGVHKISFDATNLSSGIYYYQLTCESFIQTKKMILLK